MNLIDAVKSGRSFKRKSYDEDMWCHVVNNSDGCDEIEFMTGHCKTFMAYVEDLTADDWEIQEPAVTITRTQFWEVVREELIAEGSRKEIVWRGSQLDLLQRLSAGCLGGIARKLGLED